MKALITPLVMLCVNSLCIAQTTVLPDFPVSKNSAQEIFFPSVAVAPDGRFGFSWGDDRNGVNGTGEGRGRIYSQLYNTNATPMTSNNVYTDNIQYNSTYDNFSLIRSVCTFLPNNTFIVAWHVGGYTLINSRNDDIYYTAYNANAQKIIAANQLNIVSGSSTNPYASRPQLVVMPPNQFGVVYEYDNFNGSEIGVSVVDGTTGNLIGGSSVISDSRTGARAYPSAASNGTRTVAVWTDARADAYGDIYLQQFVNGAADGANTKVNDNTANNSYNQWARVSMNADGKFVVIWLDTRSSAGGDIYAQHYDVTGQKIGQNIKLTNSNSFLFPAMPGISINKNRYVVTWTDSIPGKTYTCKFRVFDFGGNPSSNVLELTNASNNVKSYYPEVALTNSLAFFTWDDRRESAKGRVYGKALTLNGSSTGLENTMQKENTISVYPNPANGNLWIANYVSTDNNTANIYAIDGRFICKKEVENEKLSIDELPSGIYILKINSGVTRFCKID